MGHPCHSRPWGRLLARLALLAAALLLLTWPSEAQAGIGSQCVADLVSIDPASEAADGVLCGEGTLLVRRVNHLEVPICLMEGASAIAPLPLIPTDGASAEPTADCDAFHLPSEVSNDREHAPRHVPAVPMHAALPELPALPKVARRTGVTQRVVESKVTRVSHVAGVYRPPRA